MSYRRHPQSLPCPWPFRQPTLTRASGKRGFQRCSSAINSPYDHYLSHPILVPMSFIVLILTSNPILNNLSCPYWLLDFLYQRALLSRWTICVMAIPATREDKKEKNAVGGHSVFSKSSARSKGKRNRFRLARNGNGMSMF